VNSSETRLAEAIRLRREGRLTEAWHALASLVEAQDPAGSEEAALIAEQLGQRAQAMQLLEQVTARAPNRASAWVNLAAMRAEALDARGAADAARAATHLAPNLIAGWVNLGSALASLRDFSGAIEAFGRAVALEPSDTDLQFDLASAEFSAGDVEKAARRLQALLAANSTNVRARSLLLLVLHHATNDRLGLERVHADFAASQGAVRSAMAAQAQNTEGRLRIGLLSGDFRRHSVWYFLKPLLDHWPADMELVCFHTDPESDDITEQWRQSATEFFVAGTCNDDELAARILAAQLDVLVSLGGHTTAARPGLFLRRLAPVQASFLGYPGPLGSPNVDYWIADQHVAPVDETLSAGLGEPARLDPSYFCFDPGVTPSPMERQADGIVFGSFNVLAKISAVTVRLWATVLNAVEGSRLLVKTDSIRGPAVHRLVHQFSTYGVGSDRIIWSDWNASRDDHLSRYGDIDIALDTFPYNGATTTCEALWMGVPVVSLAGRTPASRMGRSILEAADCAEWCVEDEASFVALAQHLCANIRAGQFSRTILRERVANSRLCDSATYSGGFFRLLRELAAG
jgi:predicted O-linked N-acetylglucosamine transferase (SPINDLY family)